MPGLATSETRTIKVPEVYKPPTLKEQPKNPVGEKEEEFVKLLDRLKTGSEDPNKTLREVADWTISSTKQENKAKDPTILAETTANDLVEQVKGTKDDEIGTLVTKFNIEHAGSLKGQEFRLIGARGETLLIVDESGSLKEIVVTKENSGSVLADIKKQDEALKGKSYELRREILKRSEGTISTHEAYTYTVDLPQGSDFDPYLNNPENWVPERKALHEEIVEVEYAKALALSARLGDPEPTIYALRGNTASGKTRALRNNEIFRKALDEQGRPTGAINPDTYKSELKTLEMVETRQTIGHQQAHEEGSMLARKISARIADSESSMVIDKRMNKARNITELIAFAEERGKGVKILDVDVPLETSLIRVLGRKIGGDDPTVPFDVVAEGFEGVRQNRGALIEQVIKNPKIKDYVLYGPDESVISIKVAQKVNGEFLVIEGQEEAFKRAVSKETESTVSKLAGTVINERYIEAVLSRTSEAMQDKVRSSLERYKGRSFKEALDLHAQKLNEE